MLAPASQEDINEVEKNKNFKIGDKRNSFPSMDSFHFIGLLLGHGCKDTLDLDLDLDPIQSDGLGHGFGFTGTLDLDLDLD